MKKKIGEIRGEITVVFKKGISDELIAGIIALLDLQWRGRPQKGVVKVIVPPGKENYWVKYLNGSKLVKYAEVSSVLNIHKKSRK